MRRRLASQQRIVVIHVQPPLPTVKPAGWFARKKDGISSLQSLLAIIALVLAIFWFFGQHVAAEKLRLEEHVSWRAVQAKGVSTPMLWIDVLATNSGSTPIRLGPSRIAIDAINPRAVSGQRIAIGDFGRYLNGDLMTGSDSLLDSLAQERQQEPLWNRLRTHAPLSWFFKPGHRADLIEAGESEQVFAGHYFVWSDALTVELTTDIQSLDGSWWRIVRVCDLRVGAKPGEPAATCVAN